MTLEEAESWLLHPPAESPKRRPTVAAAAKPQTKKKEVKEPTKPSGATKKRRQYGSGCLVQLNGKDRWKLIVPYTAHDGSRKQTSRTITATKLEAKRRLDELVAEVERGAFAHDGDLTYGDLLERYLASVTSTDSGLSKTTGLLYRRTLQTHALPIIGKVRLRELTAEHVRRVLSVARNTSRTKQRGKPLGPTSLRNLRVHLASSLAFAFDEGLVVNNVARRRKGKKSQRIAHLEHIERVDVTRDVVRDIMAAARGTALEATIIFSLGSGARRGEMCRYGGATATSRPEPSRSNARCATSYKKVEVGNVKTAGSVRSDTLPAFAPEALRTHRRRQREQELALGIRRDDGYVFRPGPGDEPWDPNEVSRSFSRLVRRHGLPVGLRWHDLRHGFATLCFASGTPILVVSKALGHSSLSVTAKIYVHVVEKAKTAKAAALDTYLGEAMRDPAAGE